jgi:hypothetical protein
MLAHVCLWPLARFNIPCSSFILTWYSARVSPLPSLSFPIHCTTYCRPRVPKEPTTEADDASPSDEAQVAYTKASEQYMFDLSDYEDWAADDACATQILLGSMKVEFAMDLASLPSTREMWSRAAELYQSKSHTLYISILELASSIRQ